MNQVLTLPAACAEHRCASRASLRLVEDGDEAALSGCESESTVASSSLLLAEELESCLGLAAHERARTAARSSGSRRKRSKGMVVSSASASWGYLAR